jgi:hypothetical protein
VISRHQGGIVTFAPDGVSDRRWLGAVGHVSGVSYGSTMPGGDDQFSGTLQISRLYREPAIAPGRILQVWRAGGIVYEGRLDRPAPASDGTGWSVTAHGSGTYGDDYRAIWGSYTASDILTQAIGRGLRWSTGTISGGMVSQQQDSAAQSVTDFMNTYTDTVSLSWLVDQPGWPGGAVVNVLTIPTTVTRLLITTTPAAPDLVDYINALYVRYQSAADSNTGVATFALTSSTLASSITTHGRTEDFWDISSGGTLSTGSAQTDAANALAKYVAASFSQPFSVTAGHYLNTGGQPVDLAAERAGEVVRLVLAAGGFGGEIGFAWPITFPVGSVVWDDEAQHLTVTPYKSVRSDFAGLLGLLAPVAPTTAPKPKPKPKPKKPRPPHRLPRRHHRVK